jgi:hypothetical protein
MFSSCNVLSASFGDTCANDNNSHISSIANGFRIAVEEEEEEEEWRFGSITTIVIYRGES